MFIYIYIYIYIVKANTDKNSIKSNYKHISNKWSRFGLHQFPYQPVADTTSKDLILTSGVSPISHLIMSTAYMYI